MHGMYARAELHHRRAGLRVATASGATTQVLPGQILCNHLGTASPNVAAGVSLYVSRKASRRNAARKKGSHNDDSDDHDGDARITRTLAWRPEEIQVRAIDAFRRLRLFVLALLLVVVIHTVRRAQRSGSKSAIVGCRRVLGGAHVDEAG